MEFDSGVICGKPPVDVVIKRIPLLFPRSDLRSEGRCVKDPPVETLMFEHTYIDFSDIQPVYFLGR